MSDTATQDIRTAALKVAGEITATLKRLDNDVDLPTVHDKMTKLKTAMAIDFKAAASMEKVEKYQALVDAILKSMATEEKKLGEATVELTEEIEDKHKEAVDGKASGVAAQIATLKKDFLASMASYKSAGTVKKYSDQLKGLKSEMEAALKKNEAASDDTKVKWTISNKFKKGEMTGNTDKYEEWLKAAEDVGGKVAAMNLKLSAKKMQGDNRYHFKLNSKYRVYFEDKGKTVIVTGPEHEPKGS